MRAVIPIAAKTSCSAARILRSARRPADRLLGGAEETRRAVWSGVGGSEGVGEGVARGEPSAAGEGFAGDAEGPGGGALSGAPVLPPERALVDNGNHCRRAEVYRVSRSAGPGHLRSAA